MKLSGGKYSFEIPLCQLTNSFVDIEVSSHHPPFKSLPTANGIAVADYSYRAYAQI